MGVTLFKRNGFYWANLSVNGLRKRESLRTKDRRIAERIRRELEGRLVLGEYDIQPAKQDFDQFKETYLEYAKIHKRPRTVDNDRRFLKELADALHPIDLTDITVERIDRMVKACAKKGHAPATINMMLRHLSAIFGYAVKQGYLAENPFKKVPRLRVDQKPPRFLSQEQIQEAMKTAKNTGRDIHLVFALGIFAGLRKLEIANARWEWFDLERDLITVTGRGDFQLKGRRSRTLPLHAELKRILQPIHEKEGYVFAPGKDQHRGHYRFEFKKGFASVCKHADLSWVSPHVLRHTFASQLAIAGVSLYKISQWLGHKDLKTTMIYAHLQAQDEDINRFSVAAKN